MSKNFEEEYKALAENDLPDLWNRIESGLTPRTITSQNTEELEEQQKGKESAGIIVFLRKYKTVAAAAVCVILILPAALILGRLNARKNDESSPAELCAEAADTSAAMPETEEIAEDEAETAEAADEAVGETADEAGAETAKAADEAGMTEAADGAETAKAADRDEAYTDGVNDMLSSADSGSASDDGNVQEEQKLESARASGSEDAEKEIIYQNVTVKILGSTGDEVTTQKNWFHGIKAEVLSDPNGAWEQGTELTLWVSLFSSVAYLDGEEYTLDISYDPDRECAYQITVTHF